MIEEAMEALVFVEGDTREAVKRVREVVKQGRYLLVGPLQEAQDG